MTEKEWAEELVSNIAAEVKRIRKRDKISIRALAERTEKLGHPIGESVLSNFEYGRRGAKLDVAELLVLAAALEVPPTLLLFPPYPYGHVQPLPDVTTTAYDAAEWVAGHAQMTGHPNVTYTPRPHRLVELANERARLNDGFAQLNDGFAQLLERKNDPDWIDKTFELIDQVDRRRDEINDEMRELGGVLDDGEG